MQAAGEKTLVKKVEKSTVIHPNASTRSNGCLYFQVKNILVPSGLLEWFEDRISFNVELDVLCFLSF